MRILTRLKQRFCNHKLGIFYSSHYPTVHCIKCGKYATDNVNTIIGDYIDKITNNKLKEQ